MGKGSGFALVGFGWTSALGYITWPGAASKAVPETKNRTPEAERLRPAIAERA